MRVSATRPFGRLNVCGVGQGIGTAREYLQRTGPRHHCTGVPAAGPIGRLIVCRVGQGIGTSSELLLRTGPHQHWVGVSLVGPLGRLLFAALARTSEQRESFFNERDLANTVWAFLQLGYSDGSLFVVLARASYGASVLLPRTVPRQHCVGVASIGPLGRLFVCGVGQGIGATSEHLLCTGPRQHCVGVSIVGPMYGSLFAALARASERRVSFYYHQGIGSASELLLRTGP